MSVTFLSLSEICTAAAQIPGTSSRKLRPMTVHDSSLAPFNGFAYTEHHSPLTKMTSCQGSFKLMRSCSAQSRLNFDAEHAADGQDTVRGACRLTSSFVGQCFCVDYMLAYVAAVLISEHMIDGQILGKRYKQYRPKTSKNQETAMNR